MSICATDIAFNYLKDRKDGAPFAQLWGEVCNELGYDETLKKRKVSSFYTDLSVDGRFLMQENNTWNLKTHCKYDEVAASQEEIEEDIEEEEEEAEEEYEEESTDLNELF